MTMRFVLDPTEGALVPELLRQGADGAAQTAIENLLSGAAIGAIHWATTTGLVLLSHVSLVVGMACFLAAIAGKGPWLERGLKAVLVSVLAGVGHVTIGGGV
jgi:hypothetical protein